MVCHNVSSVIVTFLKEPKAVYYSIEFRVAPNAVKIPDFC